MLQIFLLGLRQLCLGPQKDLYKQLKRAYNKLTPDELYIFQIAFTIVLKIRKGVKMYEN